MSMHAPNKYRVKTGPMASDERFGNNGAFFIPTRPGEVPLKVICSDGGGWEHVSVSLPNRTPTWEEMCLVKRLFWSAETCVVQYHPPASEYVNNHAHCLHMWRPIEVALPMPPALMVGFKGLTPEHIKAMSQAQLLQLQEFADEEVRQEPSA